MGDDAFDCGIVVNSGVWYKMSIPFAANVIVSTCSQASFNTQIAIYMGSCGSLVCQAYADETRGCEATTRIIHDVEPHEIYIVVNGYGTETGDFDLMISVIVMAAPVSRW